MIGRKAKIGIVTLATIVLFVAGSAGALAYSPHSHGHGSASTHVAGGTGLTAYMVASPHETIRGLNINAAGYDIGIYVGPGVTGVKILHVTIQDANDHGIFVQDSSNVKIEWSTVIHNGVAPNSSIAENKAIELVGTTNSVVAYNTVTNNTADGGIGVADDGPFLDPGAPVASATHPMAGSGNLIMENFVSGNAFGCGIVIAAYNEGGGVFHNLVMNNMVLGNNSATLPIVGGIVVAADTPNTTAAFNLVIHNVINGSLIPGVVVHSNAPGDMVFGTIVMGNWISSNGFETPPNDPVQPTGIMIVAEAHPGEMHSPMIYNTQVLSNTVSNDAFGVWIYSAVHTHISNLKTENVGTPVYVLS